VSTTKTGVEKVANVVVPVGDQDRMIAFYEKLGFEKRVDIPFGGQYRWVEVGAGDAETTIALAPPPEGKTLEPRETGITLYAPDIESYYEQLKSDGVDVDAEISKMGGPVPPMFWFRDLEGNTLLVVGDAG
jgi:catechol 2,3-dioxygenase-like lactoylglutathione lyase family enzyme